MNHRHVVLILGLLLAGVSAARAAESYDSCTGYITTVPTTIATQGTWCLKADLATGMAAGAAITIATNNVTLDCNDFKVGGLAAGAATTAVGIQAVNRTNVTVRNCNVRGFHQGIALSGGMHLVEDNRLDNNTAAGVVVDGAGSMVRRNQVLDTGGSTVTDTAYGVVVRGGAVDVDGNTVAGVIGALDSFGIFLDASGASSVVGNRTRRVWSPANGTSWGIYSLNSQHVAILDNDVSMRASSTGGIKCAGAVGVAANNVVPAGLTRIASCFSSANLETP